MAINSKHTYGNTSPSNRKKMYFNYPLLKNLFDLTKFNLGWGVFNFISVSSKKLYKYILQYSPKIVETVGLLTFLWQGIYKFTNLQNNYK